MLVSHTSRKSSAAGRHWEESEYCVDPKSGLLMSYSPAPGMYVLYDYSNAIHFHNKIIPGKFTITEAGQTIIQAHTESVTDPSKVDPAIFEPSGLNQIGVGSLMTPPWHVVSGVGSGGTNSNRSIQVVVLHGMLVARRRVERDGSCRQYRCRPEPIRVRARGQMAGVAGGRRGGARRHASIARSLLYRAVLRACKLVSDRRTSALIVGRSPWTAADAPVGLSRSRKTDSKSEEACPGGPAQTRGSAPHILQNY